MKSLRLSVVLSLVVLGVNLGFAYIFKYWDPPYNAHPVRWQALPSPMTFLMWTGHPTNADLRTDDAMSVWENEADVRAIINLTQGTEGSNICAQDDVNRITWHDMGVPGYYALTWLRGTVIGGIPYLDEVDIDVNSNGAVTWNYGVAPPPALPGHRDFQGVMTHELGHCLCLGDLYNFMWPANIDKTMYGYGNSGSYDGLYVRRSLEQDDMDGIAYLWPTDPSDEVWIRDGGWSVTHHGYWHFPPPPLPPSGCHCASLDIRYTPDPPIRGQTCYIRVTCRNMRPVDITNATLTVEVHEPSLGAWTSAGGPGIKWQQTIFPVSIPPGNRDLDNDGLDEDQALVDGEMTTGQFDVPWPVTANIYDGEHYCIVANLRTTTDPTDNPHPREHNNVALRNIFELDGGKAGSMSSIQVFGGNPFGVGVLRRVLVDRREVDTTWRFETVPPEESLQYLAPYDTAGNSPSTVVELRMTPGQQALRGDHSTVHIRSFLFSATTGETLQSGGATWHTVVGQPGDVGVTKIVAPTGRIAEGTAVTPACSVYNFGATAETYAVRMRIGYLYDQIAYVSGHPSATYQVVTFPSWTATAGLLAVQCSTGLAMDANQSNDKKTGSVQVLTGPSGWTELTPLPAPPSGKMIKDGGCMAYDAGTDLIYASKGNKTGDFYAYDVNAGTWTAKTGIPLGAERKQVYDGSVICSDGNGKLYLTKGNNTVGFWGYDATTNAWTQLTNVPLGRSGDGVKEGGGLAWATKNGVGYVYLLKGFRNEFYRYDPASNSWTQLLDAPIGADNHDKYQTGSWLIADADAGHYLYAFKAKFHEMYLYDTDADTWSKAKAALPGNKKAKAGSCAAWYSGKIYAFKGGNTTEFWRYVPLGDSWQEQDDIPLAGRNGKRSSVEAGGALAGYPDAGIYALKGNKSLEFWRYTPYEELESQLGREGVMADIFGTGNVSFAVAPNPLSDGLATIRYSLPKSGAAELSVYNVAGQRVVARTLVLGRSGSVNLDLRQLAGGVYMMKLRSRGVTFTQKLVVQR